MLIANTIGYDWGYQGEASSPLEFENTSLD
jgi:hypothetical protein